jgi:hypothetical protein
MVVPDVPAALRDQLVQAAAGPVRTMSHLSGRASNAAQSERDKREKRDTVSNPLAGRMDVTGRAQI